MAGTLTEQDFVQLQQYAAAGDRYSYWNYLADRGDSYASLALGVVTGGTRDGYIANSYAASYALEGSALANPSNTQAWWSVGVDLMRADLVVRQNVASPLDLTFKDIEGYHAEVFRQHGLPREAWTPYIPFKAFIDTGDWAAANQTWQQILNGNGVSATLGALLQTNGASIADRAGWLATIGVADAAYSSLSITGNERASLRNANYIDGWSYNPNTGQWNKTVFSPIGGFATTIDASPTQAEFLNQERQFRLDNFGANALRISSLADPGLLNTGDLNIIADRALSETGAYQQVAGDNPDTDFAALQYNEQLKNQFAGLLDGRDFSDAVRYVDSAGIRHFVFSDGSEIQLDAATGKFATTSFQVSVDGTQYWTRNNFDDTQDIVTISPPATDGSVTTTYEHLDTYGTVTATTVSVADSSGNPIQITRTDATGDTNLLYSSDSSGSQTLANIFQSGTLVDALSLLRALQAGDPLPVVSSGLRLAANLDTLDGKIDSIGLAGASNVAGGALSLLSLKNALDRGDTFAAITAGAQALSFGAQAYANFMGFTGNNALDQAFGADSFTAQLGNSLPYLSLVNALESGDEIGIAVSAAAIYQVPYVGQVYAVYNIVSSLFGGDDDPPPEPWGGASAGWSGFTVVANSYGEHGGEGAARSTMDGFINYLNQLAEYEQSVNPGASIGVVANRLPSISYRHYSGFDLTDIDPLTGVQNYPGIKYDLTGHPYNAPAGTEQAGQSLSERFIRVALERGAIAPMWEVETAALQTQYGDPKAGLTEEERAGRNGQLAGPLTGDTQTFRPVALDLDGDGIETTGTTRSVAFDVDDSGFLKNTAWLGNDDGFLILDRNLNGQIDSGRELFNNGTVALSARGVRRPRAATRAAKCAVAATRRRGAACAVARRATTPALKRACAVRACWYVCAHATSHPATSYRFLALEKTVQEIAEKQRNHQPLVPERKATTEEQVSQ